MTHAEIIQKMAARKGVSINKLAREANINRNSLVTMLRRNQKKVRPEVYIPIANYLNIPHDLFQRDTILEEDLDLIEEFVIPSTDNSNHIYKQIVEDKFLEHYDILEALINKPISQDLLHKLMTNHQIPDDFVKTFSDDNEINYSDAMSTLLYMYEEGLFFDKEFHQHIMSIVTEMPDNELNQLITHYEALPPDQRKIIKKLTTSLYKQHAKNKNQVREHIKLLNDNNNKFHNGEEHGKMQILIPLIDDGILTYDEALARSSMTQEEFKARVEKASQEEILLKNLFKPSQDNTSN